MDVSIATVALKPHLSHLSSISFSLLPLLYLSLFFGHPASPYPFFPKKSLSLVTGLPLSLFSSNLTLLLGPLGWQQFSKSQSAFIPPRVFLVCSLMSTGFSDQSVKVSVLLHPPIKPYLNPGLNPDLIVGTLLLKKEKHTMVTRAT